MKMWKFALTFAFGLSLIASTSFVAVADSANAELAETSVGNLIDGRWQPVVDSLGERVNNESNDDRRLLDVFRAAIVLAPSGERSKLAQQLPAQDWLTEHLSELDKASTMKIDPASLSLDQLRTTASIRKSIQDATFAGRPDDISQLIDSDPSLVSELGPAGASLLAYATVMRDIASHFTDSEMSTMYRGLVRRNDQSMAVESRRESWLGDYRKDPESAETNRDGENGYSVLKAKEEAKAALVESYSKLYTAYREGELTRAKALREMAALESDLLNNREKRILLYWKLRELNKQYRLAEIEKKAEVNRQRSASRAERRDLYKTLSWPTVFSHPELSRDAAALEQQLMQYDEENSGPLSVCYAKCCGLIRSLCQTLQGNIPGIPAIQRAELSSYLRSLLSEVAAPYSSNGYIASLQLNDFTNGDMFADESSEELKIPDGLLSAEIDMSDESEVASYAIFRSLLISMIQATQASDQKRLRQIAQQIQNSGLLITQHKSMLNKVGSSLYKRVQSDVPETWNRDDLEYTLASLSGADGSDSVTSENLSDEYQAEAFDTLVNHLMNEIEG